MNKSQKQFNFKTSAGLASGSLNSVIPVNTLMKIENVRPFTSKTKNYILTDANFINQLPEHYDLKYVPKRKFGNSLVTPRIASSIPIKTKNPLEFNIKEEYKYQAKVNEACHSENDLLKVRTGYILKFASNSDYFNKTKKYFECITQEKRGIIENIYEHLRKLYDSNNRVYFDRMNCGTILDYDTWKEFMGNSYEYINSMIKLIDFIFGEMRTEKENVSRLKKKIFELDAQNSTKANDIAIINDFIKKNDLNSKIGKKKQNDIASQDFRKTFVRKENAYIMTIYRLEDEIKELSSLLEKNKIDTNKIQLSKEKADQRKRVMDEMRVVYNKEINDLNLRNNIVKDEVEDLKEQIDQLEEDKKTLMIDIENMKSSAIDLNTKNQLYKTALIQRSEIISMLNEESLMYKYQYEKERKAHQITLKRVIEI